MEDPNDVITLVADNDKAFSVNRSKLALGSRYYERLLCSGMKDSGDAELKLSLLCETGLCAVSEYLQTGKVLALDETDVSGFETLRSTLEAGSYLQMDGLLSICKDYLVSLVSSESWKVVLDVSNEYYLEEPKSSVLKYLCKNFVICSKEDDFLLLSAEDLLELLHNDETEGEEIEIFDAALEWILFENSRCDNAFKIFDAVRFPLMTCDQIRQSTDVLDTHGFHEFSENLKEEMKTFGSSSLRLANIQTSKVKQRCTTKAVLATGGFTLKEHSTSRLQLLPLDTLEHCQSTDSGKVTLLSCRSEKLPDTFCEHQSCVFNDILYIAGGQNQYCRDGRYTTNHVYCFDPILGIWSSCSSMQVPRSLFYFGELDGNLYAVTGCTSPNMDTPTVERYSPSENKWKMMNAVPNEVHELAGCKHQNTFYISGGFRGPLRGHVDLLWQYNKVEDVWEERASMMTARSYHAMASAGDSIIVAGGVKYLGGNDFADILTCEIYNPRSDQWSIVAHLEYAASCMPHVESNGTIYLFGGHSFQFNYGHNNLQIVDLKTFKTYSVSFEAHKISFFETVLINLPRKYVKKFH